MLHCATFHAIYVAIVLTSRNSELFKKRVFVGCSKEIMQNKLQEEFVQCVKNSSQRYGKHCEKNPLQLRTMLLDAFLVTKDLCTCRNKIARQVAYCNNTCNICIVNLCFLGLSIPFFTKIVYYMNYMNAIQYFSRRRRIYNHLYVTI